MDRVTFPEHLTCIFILETECPMLNFQCHFSCSLFTNSFIFIVMIIFHIRIKSSDSTKGERQKKAIVVGYSTSQTDEVIEISRICDLLRKSNLCLMILMILFLPLYPQHPCIFRFCTFSKSMPTSFLPFKICFILHHTQQVYILLHLLSSGQEHQNNEQVDRQN